MASQWPGSRGVADAALAWGGRRGQHQSKQRPSPNKTAAESPISVAASANDQISSRGPEEAPEHIPAQSDHVSTAKWIGPTERT